MDDLTDDLQGRRVDGFSSRGDTFVNIQNPSDLQRLDFQEALSRGCRIRSSSGKKMIVSNDMNLGFMKIVFGRNFLEMGQQACVDEFKQALMDLAKGRHSGKAMRVIQRYAWFSNIDARSNATNCGVLLVKNAQAFGKGRFLKRNPAELNDRLNQLRRNLDASKNSLDPVAQRFVEQVSDQIRIFQESAEQ